MASSTLATQNQAALDYFVQTPVTREMVSYMAHKATEVIRCEQQQSLSSDLPTPPPTPPPGTSQPSDPNLPPIEAFLTSIIQQSHVQVPTLMPALVYLARLRSRLPSVAQGIPSTVHRILLAALILAAKNLNDSSPKNKHWARYTSVPGYPNFCFSNSEVNLMEKQLLYLLDWDLRITNDDLYFHLEPFLAPIRVKQQQHAERKLQAMLQDREQQKAQAEMRLRQMHLRQTSQASTSSSHMVLPPMVNQAARTNIYDSPAAMPTTEHNHHYPTNMSAFAHSRSASICPSSRSSSRAPSRTPSLSPPTRCDSSASCSSSSVGTPASSLNPTPASTYTTAYAYPAKPQEAKIINPPGYYDQYNHMTSSGYGTEGQVIHIQPMMQKPLPPSVQIPQPQVQQDERTAKRIKTSVGSLFSRYLGGQSAAAVC